MDDLTKNTDEELKQIMRDTIDNSYVPQSRYNKAKQELDFRNAERNNKKEEIVKIAPEFYGVGINLKALWKKIIGCFKGSK